MRGQEESGVASAAENALEFARRVTAFGGVEADPGDLIAKAERALYELRPAGRRSALPKSKARNRR
jgi:hypothetical protein